MVLITALSYLQSDRTICLGSAEGFRVIKCDINRPTLLYSSPCMETWDVSLLVHEPGGNKVLLVTRNSPRCLRIFDLVEGCSQRHLNFTANISAIRIDSQAIVVKVSSRLHLFHPETINPLGDVVSDVDVESRALAIDGGRVAFPRTDIGHVGVTTVDRDRQIASIECFAERIAAVELSGDGFYVAVAPESGKVIRVFTAATGKQTFQFVRGLLRNARITSMAFHKEEYLAVASDSDSVHVFPLNAVTPEPTIWGTISSIARSAMRYLPIDSAEHASDQRSIAAVKLPCGVGFDNKVFLSSCFRGLTVHVGSSSGWIYESCFDSEMRMTGFYSQFLGSEVFWGEEEEGPPHLFSV